jgi:hypothetical protein
VLGRGALLRIAVPTLLVVGAVTVVLWQAHGTSSAPKRPSKRPARAKVATRSSRPAATSARRADVRLFVFAARGPSRVLVRRWTSDGPVLFDATLARGGTLKVSGPQLYTEVRQIANVNVRVDTRMVDLTCTAAGGVILTPTQAIPMHPPKCPKPLVGS